MSMAHQFFSTLFSSKSAAIFAWCSLVAVLRDFLKDLGRRMSSVLYLIDLSIVVFRIPELMTGEEDGVQRGEYPGDRDMLREVEVRADIRSMQIKRCEYVYIYSNKNVRTARSRIIGSGGLESRARNVMMSHKNDVDSTMMTEFQTLSLSSADC